MQVCVLELLVLRAASVEGAEVAGGVCSGGAAGCNCAQLRRSTKLPVLTL